ncbi:methyl-accepting chemotaxis sensory transducer [Calothrix parasitica NIES-267]|uniref:Methyl-accepting chemotaxis sensory transducer n=1 Tax=Calothrix parasitica NIES-267 TaxID=1973488 RepID=A0A1Z4LTA7_9CYAN|nr:methyl-accepting chemotaxis sensory transducer [Calothrix parasitica NIES-267]
MQVGFALDNANVLAQANSFKEQADAEAQWTNYFTDAVRVIRKSLSREDIFETSVKEVRRVMNSDRVVVYGLSSESNGVVIAESVSPGFTKAVGVTIKDPCFEARYIEKYQNGRVKATANIYEANYTSCYIEQLEKLEVKANLVAPIINEGKLLGLLVAHHCSQPHNWLAHEIKFFSQIAMQVGFALDNAKVLAEAGNLRKQADTETQWTQYFTETVKLIRQSLVKENILETATEEVRRVMDSDRVVVYGLNQESFGIVSAESVSPRFTKALGVTIKDPCFEARYIEKYQNGRVKATANIYEANYTSCYIEQLEKLEVKANLVAPIINEGKLFGLLVTHQCSKPRHWEQHEVRWFSQIAMQIGFALDNAQIIEQNSQTSELTQNQQQNIFLPQQEDLREVVIELSKNNQMIFKAFWNKALILSNHLDACRKQIQQMFETAKVMTTTASQAEQQVQKNYDLLEEERANIKSTLESISALEEAVSHGGIKVKQLNQHCQNLFNLINQLAAHLGKPNNSSYSMNGHFAENNLANGYGETVIVHTDDIHKLKEQLLEVIVETQPLLTSEMAEINQIVEVMEDKTQQISTWAKSLQTNEQKLDCIATVNMQVGKLVCDINQTAAIQTQTFQQAEQNMVLAEQVVEHIQEKLQFFTKWFAQLTTFAQNNTQKIIFWEHLKGFLASFHRLITSFTQKK